MKQINQQLKNPTILKSVAATSPTFNIAMAPPQADLRKIGAEGFALIDKFYGPARRNSVNDAFHGRRGDRCWVVYNVSNDVMEDSAAIGMEATTGHFAAKSAMNYPKAGKPEIRYWGRPLKF